MKEYSNKKKIQCPSCMSTPEVWVEDAFKESFAIYCGSCGFIQDFEKKDLLK